MSNVYLAKTELLFGYAWGNGDFGQLANRRTFKSSYTPIEVRLGGHARVVRAFTGDYHSFFITDSGGVSVCGCGRFGRLGIPPKEDDCGVPTAVLLSRENSNVVTASGGCKHSAAVTESGALFVWGYNSRHNVLGRGCERAFTATPCIVPALKGIAVKKVSCGHNFTLVITGDGQIWSWGSGRFGVLGHGNDAHHTPIPQRIHSLQHTQISDVSSGHSHCACVDVDGRVFVWGKGWDGQLGLGADVSCKHTPVWLRSSVTILSHLVAVVCSRTENPGFTIALSLTGHVYSWGNNAYGQLGQGDTDNRCRPTMIPQSHFGDQPVMYIAAGGMHSAAITQDHRLWTWGYGKDGQLGHTFHESDVFDLMLVGDPIQLAERQFICARPIPVNELNTHSRVLQVECGAAHTLAVAERKTNNISERANILIQTTACSIDCDSAADDDMQYKPMM